ncbi:MAG: lipopolysaccharide biosynthesis protein [Phycisphaerales bacterium JB043]
MSEIRRTSIRILSNYVRLGSTLAIGIILTKVLLGWLGNDGFGLVQLVLMSVGLPMVFQDIMRQSMVRPLGQAYHNPDQTIFPKVYMSSYLVSLLAAFLSLAGFGVLLVGMPFLKLGELGTTGQTMVAVEAIFTFVLIASAPISNVLVVTERFVLQNIMLVCLRLGVLIPALVLVLIGQDWTIDQKLIRFAYLSVSFKTLVVIVTIAYLLITEPSLRIRPGLIERRRAWLVMRTTGGIALVTLSTNVQTFVSGIIMNYGFGLLGNTVFGIARQLASYIRMTTVGMTFGLDAVSARISTTRNDDSLLQLAFYTTRLHALVAMPAGVFVLIFASPLLTLWVGKQMENPEQNLPYAIDLAQILAIGLIATGVGEGWTRLLYGAGYLRRYLVPVASAGIFNPIVAIILYYALPDSIKFWCAALAYSGVFLVIYGVIVPRLMHKLIDMPYSMLASTTLKPLACALLAGGGAYLVGDQFGEQDEVMLAASVVVFGLLYACVSWVVQLDSHERRTIIGMIRRRAGRRPVTRTSEEAHELQQDEFDEVTRTSDEI